ncbi:MAG: dihydrolipoamide acetyltransferase family protein [Negativicutes bacterium]
MAIEIKMPKLGLSMVTGKIGKWLSQEGNHVKKGEALLEIMTDKITNVMEAPADGVLLKIVAVEGTDLPIGAVLGIIGAAGESVSAFDSNVTNPVESVSHVRTTPPVNLDAAATTIPGEKLKVSPLARKLAIDHGIDLSSLIGTGPSGRIIKEDIDKAIAETQAVFATPAKKPGEVSPGQPLFTLTSYSGMRKVIGDNLAHSWSVAPKVDYHVSVDVAALLTLRKSINKNREDKITLTDMLVKIAARALKMRPNINIALDSDQIRRYREPHIGVAVALDSGLVVPVVKNADTKTLSAVSQEIKQFARQAREGQLVMEAMQGGTFTITNVGSYNSVDWFTPIINQPESAILGIGRTVEMPVVIDNQIAIRPMMGISFSFDHRLIDGAPAAEFLGVLLELIENPCLAFI